HGGAAVEQRGQSGIRALEALLGDVDDVPVGQRQELLPLSSDVHLDAETVQGAREGIPVLVERLAERLSALQTRELLEGASGNVLHTLRDGRKEPLVQVILEHRVQLADTATETGLLIGLRESNLALAVRVLLLEAFSDRELVPEHPHEHLVSGALSGIHRFNHLSRLIGRSGLGSDVLRQPEGCCKGVTGLSPYAIEHGEVCSGVSQSTEIPDDLLERLRPGLAVSLRLQEAVQLVAEARPD